MLMTDFLLHPDTNDLAFEKDDLHAGTSDVQQKNLLLVLDKGSLKEFPDAGIGAANFLETDDAAGFLREIRKQFIADGMEISQLGFNDQTLRIDAEYR